MRECGLKLEKDIIPFTNAGSLPMRECGLKLSGVDRRIGLYKVTPHAGVWIETSACESRMEPIFCHSPCGSVD